MRIYNKMYHNFILLFQYITKSNIESIDNIFSYYNKERLGLILDTYLVINKFRKATLFDTELNFSKKLDIEDFENKYNIKVYKIESKDSSTYLLTTDKSLKTKKIAEGYNKYTYGKLIDKINRAKYHKYQYEMGKLLEYYTPTGSGIGGITYMIYYKEREITSIYGPQGFDKLDYCKLNNTNKVLYELLKKIDNNIRYDIIINYD